MTPPAHVHVIGAGLAGLAAAMDLVAAGVRVTVHEAGPAAGGRCRSYFDKELGCRLDNGNHLLLSGNRAAYAFLDRVGARDTMAGPADPVFPFMDLATNERWTVRPNRGRVPWWLFSPHRRVPGAQLRDFLPVLSLRRRGPDATVADALPQGELYRRLLEPLAIAALNTPPETASAALLGAVMDESLALGGAACIPAYPREGLSESFIDPALAWLLARDAEILLGHRIPSLGFAAGRVTAIGDRPLASDEAVVVAAPTAAALVPGLDMPDRFEAILNVHFRYDADPGEAGFTGLIGGTAEWVFVKPGVVSVTISAGNRRVDAPAAELAAEVWHDVRRVLDLPAAMPPWRVVKEKRATFAATPDQDRRRPHARTRWPNLVLAGDWTATGLPATIEGAIRSGCTAASALLAA
ncbi:MAG: FAD-dependent oxidoreductase [Gemmatimonadaceae bacterium]|nr:FAD-dependent oxidoreductase [Acetobacteraceae bacterium]